MVGQRFVPKLAIYSEIDLIKLDWIIDLKPIRTNMLRPNLETALSFTKKMISHGGFDLDMNGQKSKPFP